MLMVIDDIFPDDWIVGLQQVLIDKIIFAQIHTVKAITILVGLRPNDRETQRRAYRTAGAERAES